MSIYVAFSVTSAVHVTVKDGKGKWFGKGDDNMFTLFASF